MRSASAELNRVNDRKDNELPIVTKSSADISEAIRPTSTSNADDANCARVRTAMLFPMWTKSNTDAEEARRANERNDKELPT